MDEQLWRQADALLEEALELPPEERRAFVEEKTAGDPALASLLQRLLLHAEATHGELAPGLRLSGLPAPDLLRGGLPEDDLLEKVFAAPLSPGSVLGRYRILGEIGRGGMALVYRAERIDGDFHQEVALKQMQGAASTETIRRFEQERQILARASHPDMARLLDGGVDGAGRPYLVMELVQGIPVDRYCDETRLTIRQRVELFLRVAETVQYAHRNLIVHRDIKPSNILVSADGHPKLLDFGIARLLDEGEQDLSLTGPGGRPMTPAFASPEQLRSEPVTILSDVYQMGLLLYLLVTGRTPYRWPSSRSPLDLAKAIADDPPAPPREALLSPPEGEENLASAEEVARRRSTTTGRLARTLEGDLGSILLMALRKEPERRYSSVAQLMEDLQRYLAGRTVRARPDSLGYRLRAFSRRHRFAVLFASLLGLSLAAFSVVMAVQARRVAAERDRATREAEISAQVSSFLTDLFQVADPGEARGNTVTAREILDMGREEIDQRMPEPSLARARLRRTMGRVYENLGLYRQALALYETAMDTILDLGAESSPEKVDLQADLGRLLIKLSRYEEAQELTVAALEKRRRALGPEDPKTLETAASLASLRLLQGRPAEAEARYRDILEAQRRTQGKRSPAALRTASSLASTLFYQGRLEEAEPLYREALAGLAAELGKNHPETLKVASNLGSIWVQQKRFEEAEPLLRETLAGRTRVLGETHPGTLNAVGNLAGLLADWGDTDEAEALYRQIYELRLESLGSDHRRTADALWDLAWVASLDPERLGESARLYTEALGAYRRGLGPEHSAVNDTLYHLAVVEARRGELDRALNRLEQAVEAGFASETLFSEVAFAALAENPRMVALQETVRSRLDARRTASPDP